MQIASSPPHYPTSAEQTIIWVHRKSRAALPQSKQFTGVPRANVLYLDTDRTTGLPFDTQTGQPGFSVPQIHALKRTTSPKIKNKNQFSLKYSHFNSILNTSDKKEKLPNPAVSAKLYTAASAAHAAQNHL